MSIDRELGRLRIQVSNDPLFRLNHREILWLHLRPALLFGLAAYFQFEVPLGGSIVAVLTVALGLVDLFWLLHDIGHLAVFKNNRHSKKWVDFLSVSFFGFPLSSLLFKTHRIHHSHPNVLFKDTAIETGPIYWSREQVERSSHEKKTIMHQNWVWFFIALPASTIFIGYEAIGEALRAGRYRLLVFVCLRWLLLLNTVPHALVFLTLPQILAGLWSGFVAGLNHFHLEQVAAPHPQGFGAQVLRGSQNIGLYSDSATWITGGLNFHIEHHLFPKVPYIKLKYLRPYAMNLAREFQLPYQQERPGKIVMRIWDKLKFVDLGKNLR